MGWVEICDLFDLEWMLEVFELELERWRSGLLYVFPWGFERMTFNYVRTYAISATSRTLLYSIYAQRRLHYICSTLFNLSNLRSIPCHKPKDLIHCPRLSIHHPHPYHNHPSSLLINLPQTPPHTTYPRPNKTPHSNGVTPSCKQNQPLITSPITLQDLSRNRYPS